MELVDKNINEELNKEISATETRKEDDLYMVGPFWIIGESLSEINKGNFKLIAPTKVLVDWEGNYQTRTTKDRFLHKYLWNDYKHLYNNVEYDYFPRGRVAFNSIDKEIWVNIPKGLNENFIIPEILKEFDIKIKYHIKYTDPTSGRHYSFRLN